MNSTRRRRTPLLAATLIVKDEADNLPTCLDSLSGLVDEIVVYDTGSSDDTVAIARSYGARVIEGYWDDDFARARNASLDAVRAEWIIWVDADDQVAGSAGPALRAYLNGDTGIFPGAPPARQVDLIRLRVVNVSASDIGIHALESVRLARRSRVRWHGRIHELLQVPDTPDDQTRAVRLEPDLLHIRHRGYADQDVLVAKAERNVHIAQSQLDDLVARGGGEPDQARRAAYDLARSLLMTGRTQEAVDALEVVRELADDGGYRAMATLLLAQTLLDAGGHDDVALFLAEELAADDVTSRQFSDWLRAQALARLGHRDEALRLLRGITELVDPAGNRQSLERVLLARALFAGAEGLIEEAASVMLDLVRLHGPQQDRCLLLLKLWKGRHHELAEALAADAGLFGQETLQALAGLGRAGEEVAELARDASPGRPRDGARDLPVEGAVSP